MLGLHMHIMYRRLVGSHGFSLLLLWKAIIFVGLGVFFFYLVYSRSLSIVPFELFPSIIPEAKSYYTPTHLHEQLKAFRTSRLSRGLDFMSATWLGFNTQKHWKTNPTSTASSHDELLFNGRFRVVYFCVQFASQTIIKGCFFGTRPMYLMALHPWLMYFFVAMCMETKLSPFFRCMEARWQIQVAWNVIVGLHKALDVYFLAAAWFVSHASEARDVDRTVFLYFLACFVDMFASSTVLYLNTWWMHPEDVRSYQIVDKIGSAVFGGLLCRWAWESVQRKEKKVVSTIVWLSIHVMYTIAKRCFPLMPPSTQKKILSSLWLGKKKDKLE